MARVFNRIRIKLLAESRFARYLVYAIGEIVLVVIGILIALQINTWNLERKNEQLINTFFDEVEQDLLIDITQLDRVISFYEKRDSLIGIALSDSVTFEMYNEIKGLSSIVEFYTSAPLHKNGFNNLSRNIEKIHSRYGSLMALLNKIYVIDFVQCTEYAEVVKEYTLRRMEDWGDKYDWYYTSYYPPFELEDPRIEFYLNDPLYKNTLYIYREYSIENYLRFTSSLHENAIQALLRLHKTKEDSLLIADYYGQHFGELSEFTFKSCDRFENRPREIEKGSNILLIENKTDDTIFFKYVNNEAELSSSNAFKNGLEPNDFILKRINADTEYLLSNQKGECIGTFRTGEDAGFVVIE